MRYVEQGINKDLVDFIRFLVTDLFMLTLYESLKRNENINVNALYFENKSYTFKEVVKNVEKMVTYLQNKGIKENDVVTVVLPNVPVTIYLFYALNAIGAIQNIVHPLTPAKQIIKTIIATNCSFYY